MIFLSLRLQSASLMHTQVTVSNSGQRSDKCRYSCIKNSSQLGGVCPLGLISMLCSLLFFCIEVTNNHYKWRKLHPAYFIFPLQELKIKQCFNLCFSLKPFITMLPCSSREKDAQWSHGLVCQEQAYWNCCAAVWVLYVVCMFVFLMKM